MSILGKKIGMTQVYNKDGAVVPVTVIEAGPCSIVNLRTVEKEGYNAVQLGYEESKKENKPKQGYFKKQCINKNFKYLKEFRLEKLDGLTLGQEIKVDIFKNDELVNVTGISIGKGFQGVIKRWHASRGPMTHGSKHHRLPGSSGAGTTPGRVLPGKRRPGRMGGNQVTTRNLRVVSVDPEKNLILIKGAVPGSDNGFLVIRSTGKFVKAKEIVMKTGGKAKVKPKGK